MDFRKKEQLELFEIILNNLLDFIDDGKDSDKFKEVFESLPINIYDKIIDLEDLSFKKRDSTRFHIILHKSKEVAKAYNKLFKK